MNKIFKNLISIMAALTLCYALFGVLTAMAEDPVRNLSVELLGVEKADGSIESRKRLTEDQGKTFWIGVTADNLDSHTLFKSGIYSFEIAFEYDPTYVTPYTSGTDTEGSWKQKIADGNLLSSSDSSYNTKEWWDADLYEVSSSAISSELNDSPYRKANPTGNTTGWKMCTVSIRVKVTDSTFETAFNSGARFKGLTDSSKQTFIKLPFTVVNVPANPLDNPVVLNLVRGPQTFDIGSGVYGASPHYEWYESSDDTYKANENLRLLFDDNADITFFGVGGASITDIAGAAPTPEPVAAGDPTPTPEPVIDALSLDKSMNAEGFDSDVNTYYLSVPNEVDKLILNITASNEPDSVVANGNSVTLDTNTAGVYTYEAFDLAELDKTAEADGFNNTVVVTDNDGSTTYTIYVRRLLKPKIVLNYGNSPYGEIMKADNIPDADKQAAKNAFNEGNIYKTYIPTAAAGKIRNRNSTPLKYNTNITTYPYNAWVEIASISSATEQQLKDLNDPDINMDRNDYAIFIYNEKYFVDPGFVATDAMGDTVTNLDREITVNRMTLKSDNGIYDGNYASQTITIEDKPSEYLVTEITKPYANTATERLIRPDKYTMTYSFTDSYTGETVTEDRYVIVLQTRGDTNFSSTVNLQDLNKIYQYFNKKDTYFKTSGTSRVITGTARNIYIYRCLDILSTNTINLQDLNPIYQFFNKYAGLSAENKALNNNPLEEWYVELPDSL